MRKLLIVLLASVLLLSACGKGVEDVTTAVTTSPITDSVTTTEAPAETTVTQNEPKIELVTRTESIGSVQGSTRTYVYPSVTIEDNSELSAKINGEIEAACVNLFKRSLPGAASMVNGGSEIFYKTSECNYYLHNGKYLFVEFYVTIDIFGGVTDEMPDKAYSAVAVDMETGRAVYSENLIKDLDKLKIALRNGEFTITNGITLTESDIDAALVQYRVDYGIYPSVYFDGENVTVCVELAKLQGGYALFEASADKTADYLTDQFIN